MSEQLKEEIINVKNKELIAIILQDGFFQLDWEAAPEQILEDQALLQEKLFGQYTESPDRAMFLMGFLRHGTALSPSLDYLRLISASFIKKLSLTPSIELLREKAQIHFEEDEIKALLQVAPYLKGSEALDHNWIKMLIERLNKTFCIMITSYEGSVEAFLSSLNPDIHLAGRIYFHLVENKNGEYPFAFLATYLTNATREGTSKHLPLKNALIEYGENSKKLLELLSTVNRACDKSSFIAELVRSGEIFHPIGLNPGEAYTFLKEIPIYEDAGILCRIPNWWRNKSDRLRMSISVGDKSPSRLNFDALVDFNVRLLLGEEAITEIELKKLLSEAEGLTFIKGKWVEVNHEKLREILKAYEQAQKLENKRELSIVEALRFQLNVQRELNVPESLSELEVTNGEWLNSILTRLRDPEKIEPVTGGDDFHAKLRTYQERGLSWLYFMKSLGLGACLADDMGLGKTVQVIGLLNYCKTNGASKTLLVVPTSLIGNWTDEILKFAPSIKYCVLHPAESCNFTFDEGILQKGFEVYITTYGMLSKYEWIKNITWNSIILDEAQAIKNPGTRQARAVKQIKAGFKIAMTGTPIENHLSDLWSLFDFLNRGLLGSSKEFSDFTKKLKEDQEGYARLKKVISPFILRRLKTDKSVISDLPEKIEMKSYASLSKKQVVLYSKLVEDLKIKLESTEEGIERRGLVLSSLMKFKQICNHPDQYLGQNAYSEKESGKFERLREICETIYEKRERVLVFTQFKEITEYLSNYLETIFQHKGLVLHGETPVNKRKNIVNRFQGQEYVPFMVLSIKAGGVGLNLTSANHVIHFDRWWNPAVENQATDRAFRIGQRKNVIVHKFITKGTIEEKIDFIIEDKIKLSREIIPDFHESWITEMDNKQLMDLFRLS